MNEPSSPALPNPVSYTEPKPEPSCIGEIPKHWEVLRLKHWVQINESVLSEATDPDLEFRYMEIGGVNRGEVVEPPQKTRFSAAPSRARRVVKAGDTIISTVRTYLKAVWHAENPGEDLVCSTGFAVLTPQRGTNPKFVNYLVQSERFTDRVTAESVGTAYPAISENKLGSFEVSVPPPDEQAAIVRYLDDAVRSIRDYVSAKEKLIALLEEERQAVIHQAVTRGLDPNVRLKPSGVEWLGDVPEHWNVRRLKLFYSEADERSITGSEELMSVSHKTGVTPRKKNVTMFLAESNEGHKVCRPGDIVVNTMWAYMAALGVSRQTGLVSPSYGVYRPIRQDHLNPDYVDVLLRTEDYRTAYLMLSTGITDSRLRLYADSFLGISLLHPPPSEQTAIVRFIDEATTDIDAAIELARRQVELMEEYRTRLIADVVTGKIDVRES